MAVDNPANPTVTATTPAVTITDPPTITLSGPASAEASAAGAGADVTETVSAPGLTTIYESVITAAGIQETGWQAVSLDASGNGSFTAHLAATGDQIVAVDNPANPTVTATTPAVTITDPPTITLSGPASAEASAAGAGADVTETVSAPGLTTIYESVITAAGIQETGWQAVSLDASGNGSFTAHLAATGDQIVAVDNPANPTVTATTPAVTITDPPTITLSGPASAEASAAGAGADVTETVSAPGLTTTNIHTSGGIAFSPESMSSRSLVPSDVSPPDGLHHFSFPQGRTLLTYPESASSSYGDPGSGAPLFLKHLLLKHIIQLDDPPTPTSAADLVHSHIYEAILASHGATPLSGADYHPTDYHAVETLHADHLDHMDIHRQIPAPDYFHTG